ncbi:MAG: hypothetical protein KAT68_04830 [Bacteroidales bacterium]|nr:hypothetical protein [Bacteroidales bacterium]
MKTIKKLILFSAIFALSANFSFGQWSPNGSKIFYNDGNVGIGTNNPSAKLHIYDGIIKIDHSSYPLAYFMKSGALKAGIGFTDELRFSVGSNGLITDTKMVINHSGYVGIGTENPINKLTIISESSNAATAFFGAEGTGTAGIYFDASNGDGAGLDYASLIQKDDLSIELNNYGNNPINFRTNNNDRMTISGNGNVGIGTTSLYYKLDVAGTINATDIKINGQSISVGGSSVWSTSGSNIYRSNGNVGIGTNNPNLLLSVSSSTGGGLISVIDTENDESSANPYLAYYYGTSPTRLGYVGYGSTGNNDLYVTNDKGGLRFRDNTGEVMYVNGGNVGIGTTDPDYKLEVDAGQGKGIKLTTNHQPNTWGNALLIETQGSQYTKAITVMGPDNTQTFRVLGNGETKIENKLYANEIEVKIGVFPDFVFNKDYNLKSLDEVESFIKENKHLPDVPSENEVKENGLNLGEMDAILLQKIEELTLYIIEQNKRIEELESK